MHVCLNHMANAMVAQGLRLPSQLGTLMLISPPYCLKRCQRIYPHLYWPRPSTRIGFGHQHLSIPSSLLLYHPCVQLNLVAEPALLEWAPRDAHAWETGSFFLDDFVYVARTGSHRL